MKTLIRNYGVGVTPAQKQQQKIQLRDTTIARGTRQTPSAPRDIFAQSGPRGVLLNWRMPEGFSSDITGFRIYKDDEMTLFYEVHDPSTTQHFVEASSGSTPPVTNFFVSSVNKLGIESPKAMVQSSAAAESGAPSLPSTPPTYKGSSGNGRNVF